MKSLNQLFIATLSVLFLMNTSSCTNSRTSSQEIDLKRNSQLKERVFEQILNDEELFTEFLEEIREDREAVKWMGENRPMMEHFYSGREMRNFMRRNPQMHRQMMENMMKMIERDTTLMPMKPEMREQMMMHMMEMMERDSIMYSRMQQMMKGHMMNNN